MTLSEPIKQAIIIGTKHIEDASSVSSCLQPMISQHEIDLEAKILLHIGGESLRTQAGYIVLHDHCTLPEPAPIESRSVINAEARQHLMLMLKPVTDDQRQKSFFYAELLREWCFHTGALDLRLPEEWLVEVLKFGHAKKDLRPYLLPLMGERGKWLAQKVTNQDWNWALETENANLRYILKHKHPELEGEIIQALVDNSIDILPDEHTGLQTLLRHKSLWSDDLARIIISAFDGANITASEPATIFKSILNQSAYFFPLTQVHNLLNVLVRGKENWQMLAHSLHEKFLFRRAMIGALYESKLQTGKLAEG